METAIEKRTQEPVKTIVAKFEEIFNVKLTNSSRNSSAFSADLGGNSVFSLLFLDHPIDATNSTHFALCCYDEPWFIALGGNMLFDNTASFAGAPVHKYSPGDDLDALVTEAVRIFRSGLYSLDKEHFSEKDKEMFMHLMG